ncbi:MULTISPECIES: hypothetical protein [Shewanella]|uniref:Uncharacterized protein n=1 Tax=Shewanella bicestrii TaxID=2018305 RepID=A0A220USK2_9GAMM|nr:MULTISPECIES: hypothetical protein [Shewanella]QXN24812.1 hypothetical protein KVP08_020100 [Shewanella putrefaciens]ASK70926.1 hypothetical protein CF168_19755 [Shewanella bicestrii]MDH0450485.1 hypothetical protein [Shewanella sp. GD04112]MDH1472188.1 hypothetical protein [Shewanella sp. GD03713]VEE61863.1 Uncharacterised protein [Shewanella putrefaciens]
MPTIYIKTTLNPDDNQYHLHSTYDFVTERKFVGMRDKQLSKEQLSLALTDEDALTPQFFAEIWRALIRAKARGVWLFSPNVR